MSVLLRSISYDIGVGLGIAYVGTMLDRLLGQCLVRFPSEVLPIATGKAEVPRNHFTLFDNLHSPDEAILHVVDMLDGPI